PGAVGLADAALALVAEGVDVGALGEGCDPRRVGAGGGAPLVVAVGVGPARGGDVLEPRPAVVEGAVLVGDVGDRAAVGLQADVRARRIPSGQQRGDRIVGQTGQVMALPVAPLGV